MRKNKAFIFLLIAVSTILQCTVLNRVKIFSVKPDILLVIVLFYSLYHGPMYALGVGATCGLFMEATSGIPHGLGVCTYALSGIMVARWARIVYVQKVIGQVASAFIFTFLTYSMIFAILYFSNIQLPLINTFSFVIIPSSLYTACAAPLIFNALHIVSNLER